MNIIVHRSRQKNRTSSSFSECCPRTEQRDKDIWCRYAALYADWHQSVCMVGRFQSVCILMHLDTGDSEGPGGSERRQGIGMSHDAYCMWYDVEQGVCYALDSSNRLSNSVPALGRRDAFPDYMAQCSHPFHCLRAVCTDGLRTGTSMVGKD